MPTVFTGKKPSEWTQATIDAVKAALGIPKVYRALISQSGTSAPLVKVLSNTIGAIVWSRLGVGNYAATLAGAFPQFKVAITITGNSGARYSYIGTWASVNAVHVASYYTDIVNDQISPTQQDSLLGGTDYVAHVEILVYP